MNAFTNVPTAQPAASDASTQQSQALITLSQQETFAGSSSSYLQLLSRISPSLRAPLSRNILRPEMEEKYPCHNVLNLLLQQPPEIKNQVLRWLEPEELLRLRATCHALHAFIHESERAICLSLTDRIAQKHNISDAAINVPDLSTFFRLSKQYDSACQVAMVTAERIARHLKSSGQSDDKNAVEAWRARKAVRLQERLTRSFIHLQIYLNFLLDTMIRNEADLSHLDEDDYVCLHHIFDLDQQQFLTNQMSTLTERDFVDITAALVIFKSICKARCVPFTLKSHTHPFTSVRQILIYKGLAPFAKLLARDTGLAQQDAFLRRISREIGQYRKSFMASAAQESSCTLAYELKGYKQSKRAFFDPKRGSKARDSFISHQDIWDRSARAYMMRKLGRYPTLQSSTTWIVNVVAEEERESQITLGPWDMSERG